MANMTGGTAGTMATWTPEVWSRTATITYRPLAFLSRLMDRRWEPELGVGRGDLVNIPSFSQNSGAVARTTFGTAAALSSELVATTEAQVQLIVNKMAIYGFAMPKEGKLQALPSYYTYNIEGIATSLARYLEQQLAGDNSNGIDAFSTVVGTDNVDITEDDLLTCQTNLLNQNAPPEGWFIALSPASKASVMKIEAVRNSLYRQSIGNLDADKGQGYVGGPVFGFDFYCSNELEAGSAGKKNGAWQREAIALCVQQEVSIDKEFSVIDGLLEYVAGSIVFGHKEVKDGFGNELDGK